MMPTERKYLVLALILLLGLAHAQAETDDENSDWQKLVCADIREISTRVEKYARERNTYPGPTAEISDIGVLKEYIATTETFPMLDPWGHPYLYWCDGTSYLIASTGQDGTPDAWNDQLFADERGTQIALEEICRRAPANAGADVLFTNGRFCGLPKTITHAPPGTTLTDEDKQRITVEDIRSITTALRSYAVDNNVYPVLVNGMMTMDRNLRALLEPLYIRTLPVSDAWEHPYLYWSNGTDYMVLSPGKNGEDRDYGQWLQDSDTASEALKVLCRGAVALPEDDIIFANDQFCQWPAVLSVDDTP